MSYTLETMFPKGSFSVTNLSTIANTVGSAFLPIYVTGGVLIGGAASHVVLFRSQDATTTYYSVKVPAGKVITMPSFKALGGLKFLTADPAGDVGVALSYVEI